MKFLFLLLFCSSAFATELILLPGSHASCNSRPDIFRSKVNNALFVSIEKKKIKNNKANVRLKFVFAICKFDSTNNKYVWQINKTPQVNRYSISDKNVSKIYKEKKLIVHNDSFDILKTVKLDLEKAINYVDLELDKNSLSINNFPLAQDRGNYYFEFALRATFDSYVNDDLPIFGVTNYGSWRVFLD